MLFREKYIYSTLTMYSFAEHYQMPYLEFVSSTFVIPP